MKLFCWSRFLSLSTTLGAPSPCFCESLLVRTLGEPEEKKAQQSGEMENEICEWKAQLSMPAGVSPAFLIPVAGTAYPCESSASSSPAVTAPCLWLSLPEPVIISNQGKVPAHAVRGDGSAACWSSLCCGKPWRNAPCQGQAHPSAGAALLLTDHTWKMTLAKLVCNLGLLNVPGSKTHQGVLKWAF